MIQYKYFDANGNKCDIKDAYKIEVHKIVNNTSVKISYWTRLVKQKLRNTYTVPSGMKVVVNTPSGEKSYTGGQFVPPEQLQNARVVSKGDSSKKGQAPQQPPGDDWNEISERLKSLDISSDENINKLVYTLKSFCPCKVESSSKKIQPATKLGCLFSAANIANSVAFIGQMIQPYTIYLTDETYSNPFGENFIREGVLSLENSYIKYYQKNIKKEASMSDVSNFISSRIGHIVIYSIYSDLVNLKSQIPELTKQQKEIKKEIQEEITNFAKSHNGRVPKEKELPILSDLSEQLQGIAFSLQKNDLLTPLIKDLKDAVLHEGGLTRYIDNSLEEDLMSGVVNQFAKVISMANNYSLGSRKTFNDGMENIAGTHPETLAAIKNLMDALNAIGQNSSEDTE